MVKPQHSGTIKASVQASGCSPCPCEEGKDWPLSLRDLGVEHFSRMVCPGSSGNVQKLSYCIISLYIYSEVFVSMHSVYAYTHNSCSSWTLDWWSMIWKSNELFCCCFYHESYSWVLAKREEDLYVSIFCWYLNKSPFLPLSVCNNRTYKSFPICKMPTVLLHLLCNIFLWFLRKSLTETMNCFWLCLAVLNFF